MKAFIIITGASAGIGAAYARQLAQAGESLILIARREKLLQSLKEELSALGAKEVRLAAFDMQDQAALDDFCEQLAHEKLAIKGLINNAGFGLRGRFAELSLERQMQMVDLNVKALMLLCHRLLPFLTDFQARMGGAFLINVASTAAFQAGPNMAVYYASKAFVLSFTEALHEELRSTGLAVQALCPGATESEFADVADMRGTPLFKMGVMSASAVVKTSLSKRDIAIVVPGFKNWLLGVSTKISPRALTRAIAYRLQR